MTTPDRPPFLPMSDDERYYVRDPKSIFNRTDAEFRTFVGHLLALTAGLDALDDGLSPDQRALVGQLRDELGAAQSNTRMLVALVRELAGYNLKLTAQRQSARNAYNAGWDARYADLLSRLHPEDHDMLRWIVEHIAADSPENSLF